MNYIPHKYNFHESYAEVHDRRARVTQQLELLSQECYQETRFRQCIKGRRSRIVVVVVVGVVVVVVVIVVVVVVVVVVLAVLVVVDAAVIFELQQPSREFPSKQAAMNNAVTRLQ